MRSRRLQKLTHANAIRTFSLLAATLMVWALGAAPGASAAVCGNTFTGADGHAWNDAANWSLGVVPDETQDACVPAGVGTVVIGSGVSAWVHTIVAASPMTIQAGGFLTIKDSSTAFTNELSSVDVEGALGSEGSWISLSGTNTVEGEIGGPSAVMVTLASGSLAGDGTIEPRFNAAGGRVEPGGPGAVGTLHFHSAYSQGVGATLELDLASDSSFDRIVPPANTDAFVEGTIDVHAIGAYAPAVGTGWQFISGISGVTKGWTVTPSQFSAHSIPGGAELTLNSALPTGPTDPGEPTDPGSGGGSSDPGGGSTDPGTGGTVLGGTGATDGLGHGSASNPLAPAAPSSGDSVHCVVPRLKGLTLKQAKRALRAAHCAPGKVTRKSSSTVKKGRVIGAGKSRGTVLPSAARVNLSLSRGVRVRS